MIIDFHAHLYPPSFMVRREEIISQDETFALLFGNPRPGSLPRPNSSWPWTNPMSTSPSPLGSAGTSLNVAREANEYILRAAASSDDRLTPFCSVNPAWGNEAVQEIERCAARGARGIGELHPDTQGFDITNHNLMSPLMDAAPCP